jgi:hypothetical protein
MIFTKNVPRGNVDIGMSFSTKAVVMKRSDVPKNPPTPTNMLNFNISILNSINI